MHVMNDSSTTFLWLKYQILIYFEDLLKTIEVRPRVYKNSDKQRCFYNYKCVKGIKINVRAVIEQAYKVFDYE